MAGNTQDVTARLRLIDDGYTEGMNDAQDATSNFKSKASSALKGLASVVKGAFAGAGIAIGAFAVSAVKTGDEYQKAVNSMKNQTGATGEELDGLAESMENIYKVNLGESFDDVAQSLADVKRATGLTGKDLEDTTKAGLKLANMFEYDVGDSSLAASKLMKQFGVSGEEAMNLIAQGAQGGLDKSGDMLDTIDEYSVSFAQAGLDAEDMFAIMQNAGDAGVRNMDYVGDAIKELGIRMVDGSKTTSDALKNMGLDSDKLTSDFAKGGDTAKAAYQEVFKALASVKDPIKQNEYGVALLGTKWEDLGAKGSLALGNLDSDITKSKKALGDLNKIQYNSFGEALSGIGRLLSTELILPISKMLLPILNKFANWLVTALPKAIEVIKGVFGGVGESASKLGETFNNIKQQAASFVEVYKSIFSKLVTVLTPVFETIKNIVVDAFKTIMAWWNENGAELLTNIKTVFNGILTVVQFVMPLVLSVVKMVWDAVKNVITGALDVISGVYKIFAGLFTGDWAKMWDGIKQLVTGAVKLIWGLINLSFFGRILKGARLLFTSVKGVFVSMWAWIKSMFTKSVASVSNTVSKMFTSVVNYFKKIYSNARSIFTLTKTFVTNIFSRLWITLKSTVSNIAKDIANGFKKMYNAVKGIVQNVFNWVKNKFTAMKNSASNITTALRTAVTNAWNKLKANLLAVVNSLRERISNAFNSIKTKVVSITSSIKTAVTNGWNAVKNAISTKVSSIKTTVSNGFSSIVNTVRTKVSGVATAVRNGFSNAIRAASNFVSSGVSVGRNLISGFINGVRQKAGDLVNSVTAPVKDAIGKAKSLLGIHSPSRVFKKIGGYTSEGFALGIQSEGGLASKAMTSVINGLPTNALASAGSFNYGGEISQKLSMTAQPAYITMNLGGQSFTGFVADITKEQQKSVQLFRGI